MASPSTYFFSRPWGIPVRYHDFRRFRYLITPDLWEFHLSYADMDLDPSLYLDFHSSAALVVHAPELLSGSRLMDLASVDEAYREWSVIETQRVINITREINTYFDMKKVPLIVANIGGFSMDQEFSSEQVNKGYEQFAKSLRELDSSGVELLPQTMAPFPWHFGGQRYQNLFVRSDDIIDKCKQFGLRICFDISHSYLTCQHFGEDFYEFSSKVAPFAAHLHIGDARGVNGEGLQIGVGDIDFSRFAQIINEKCPKASFIPEIWQGHKNNGEGFWSALNKLEKYFGRW